MKDLHSNTNKKSCAETIRENIKNLRNEKGLTQEGFAEKIGANMYTVSAWERGKANPTIESLIDICNAFGCDLDYLAGRISGRTHDSSFVMDYTGLTETAVDFIRGLDKKQLYILNLLLCNESGLSNMLQNIYEGREYARRVNREELRLDFSRIRYRYGQKEHTSTVYSSKSTEVETMVIPPDSEEEQKQKMAEIEASVYSVVNNVYYYNQRRQKIASDFDGILDALSLPLVCNQKYKDPEQILQDIRKENADPEPSSPF